MFEIAIGIVLGLFGFAAIVLLLKVSLVWVVVSVLKSSKKTNEPVEEGVS